MTRHFLKLTDLTQEELLALLDDAVALKQARKAGVKSRALDGKTVVVLLDKASTRTRVSFEVGIYELGALPVTLLSQSTQLGRGEPLDDTARMLSGYAHAVVYRTFGHDRVERLAEASTIPVINGLTDLVHPCQLLADLMTVREHVGEDLAALKVAWIGDGNNMAHSWIHAAQLLGFDLKLACPAGYVPSEQIMASATQAGARVRVCDDVHEAAAGAQVVTTDVWASMGQEDEAQARREAFAGFMVDDAVMSVSAPQSVFLHCLPAHRGEEVSASVIDGPHSRVWDEAENRLHSQKALLRWLIAPAEDKVT